MMPLRAEKRITHIMGKRKKHTAEQIVRKLREADRLAEAGNSVEEIGRQIGVSGATIYNWRKRYGSMGVDEVKELHRLKDENARLKRLVADKELENLALKEIAEGNF